MKNIKKITIVGVVAYIIMLSFCLNIEITLGKKPHKETVLEFEIEDNSKYLYTWDDGSSDCY